MPAELNATGTNLHSELTLLVAGAEILFITLILWLLAMALLLAPRRRVLQGRGRQYQ